MLRHRDEDESPQLPSGYSAMLLVALVPPLWFRIMNPRVAAWSRRRATRLLATAEEQEPTARP
jgi:hypothetical protein